MKTLNTFLQLKARARTLGPRTVAVAAAHDEVALSAVGAAFGAGIAVPILVGDEAKIRAALEARGHASLADAARIIPVSDPVEAAREAVALVRAHEADMLLKGHLRTDQLLRAVVDKNTGLRMRRVMSDVLIYEDTLSGIRRFVAITDGGLNVAPTLEQKVQIIENAVAVMHALGMARPLVALMSATEAVIDAIPSTVEARRITELLQGRAAGDYEIYGPLALDNALLAEAAHAKGITSPVAGHADIMVLPNIEAGNILGKAVKYFAGSQCAHVIMGAKAPVLIPSRVESVEDKLNSLALGVLIHAGEAIAHLDH